MIIKKILSLAVAAAVAIPSLSAFAIEQSAFDKGMRKGIEYFGKGLYYEARDEFQWFCDNNWWRMNDGQRSYALEYLDGTKAKFSEYVQVYFLGYGYIETDWIHKSRIDEYMKRGWSTTKPKAQYDTTDTILKDKAVAYLKSSLYWPNSATIHQTRVVNKEDEWDRENGFVPCDVYIDYTAMTRGGFYSRSTSIVSMEFNRYNGEYSFYDIEW